MQPPESISEAKLWAVILGAAGAAISLTFIKDLTWSQKLAMGISGVVISVVFTDPVVELVNMPPSWSNGIAFLVGMFGWSVAGSISAAIRKADLWGLASDLIRSWFARKGG